MKTLIASLIVTFAAALPAKALDTTVSNEFLCKWEYVNPKIETALPVLAMGFSVLFK